MKNRFTVIIAIGVKKSVKKEAKNEEKNEKKNIINAHAKAKAKAKAEAGEVVPRIEVVPQSWHQNSQNRQLSERVISRRARNKRSMATMVVTLGETMNVLKNL